MSTEGDPVEDDETYSTIRTVLGTTERTERWHLTDEVDVLTALGRARFDLRLVETTGRPVAEISVKCFLGSVSLIVPPGTLVVLDGTSFLASANCQVEAGDGSDLPRIEVTATTVLGRVKIVSSESPAVIETLDTATAETTPPETTPPETTPPETAQPETTQPESPTVESIAS
jgi:hypothetical protein